MRSPSILSQCLAGFLSHEKAAAHCVNVVPERESHPPSPAVEIVPSKGKVSVVDIVGLSGSEVITPKGEGPLKCCESSIDLVNVLKNEIRDGLLTFRSKQVLEGASTVHFQDPSAEIIRCKTIPNVLANLEHAQDKHGQQQGSPLTPSRQQLPQDIHFYAGEWEELHTVLSVIQEDEVDTSSGVALEFCEDDFLDGCSSQDASNICHETSSRRSRKLSGSRAWERGNETTTGDGGYDILLVNEIPYSASSLQNLYLLVKKCLRPPYGVMYLAARKNYIGSSSAVRQLRSLVDEEGAFGAHLVSEPPEREIWKFFFK
uniref:Uncharacterized protein n=1 Tax=Oryza sativa subsp. japonica TaxID=39947 RepID=Q69IM8_ORYSJ|nr:hypothetical protein [Oryza sativa Japonica Group]